MAEIIPETKEEERIINSRYFQDAYCFGIKRRGHPERTIGKHVESILQYIDCHNLKPERQRLRLTAMLHDLGKPIKEQGMNHSEKSFEIAREFTSDPVVLKTVIYHDEYWRFFKRNQKERFDEPEFRQKFSELNLDFLVKFMYCDSNSRETDSIEWFKQECMNLGLTSPRPFKLNLIYGGDCSLDGLKAIVRTRVLEGIIQPLYTSFGVEGARNYVPYLLSELRILKEEADLQNLSPDENSRKSIADLNHLINAMNQLGSKKNQDNDAGKEIITTVNKYLSPLCDYSDLKDPKCPACPNKEEQATQESWLEHISPSHYIQLSSSMFLVDFKGFKVPQNLIDK